MVNFRGPRPSRPAFLAGIAVTVVAGGLLLPPAPAAAKVRVGIAADGTKVIFNEGDVEKSRRLSARLLPIPDPLVEEAVRRSATEEGLAPRLVQAVMQVESGYNPAALSNKGAMGLMQLMPGTARDLEVADPWDIEANVRGGVRYLRTLLDRFQGRLDHALAGYNAGPEAVARHRGVPPYRETRDYVRRVLHLVEGRDPGLGGRVVVRRDPERGLVISGLEPAAPAARPRR